MTLTVTAAPDDQALADRIGHDLKANGQTVVPEVAAGSKNLLIAIFSPASVNSPAVLGQVYRALDNGQHVIAVLAKPTPLPKLIDHLRPLDFSTDYQPAALLTEIQRLTAPDAPLPLKVLTPNTRRKNNNLGYWLALLALVWLIIGFVAIGIGGLQAPRDEYNSIETIEAATVNAVLARNIPRSTDEAANFPATLLAAPTAQRPLLIGTATAINAPRPTRSSP